MRCLNLLVVSLLVSGSSYMIGASSSSNEPSFGKKDFSFNIKDDHRKMGRSRRVKFEKGKYTTSVYSDSDLKRRPFHNATPMFAQIVVEADQALQNGASKAQIKEALSPFFKMKIQLIGEDNIPLYALPLNVAIRSGASKEFIEFLVKDLGQDPNLRSYFGNRAGSIVKPLEQVKQMLSEVFDPQEKERLEGIEQFLEKVEGSEKTSFTSSSSNVSSSSSSVSVQPPQASKETLASMIQLRDKKLLNAIKMLSQKDFDDALTNGVLYLGKLGFTASDARVIWRAALSLANAEPNRVYDMNKGDRIATQLTMDSFNKLRELIRSQKSNVNNAASSSSSQPAQGLAQNDLQRALDESMHTYNLEQIVRQHAPTSVVASKVLSHPEKPMMVLPDDLKEKTGVAQIQLSVEDDEPIEYESFKGLYDADAEGGVLKLQVAFTQDDNKKWHYAFYFPNDQLIAIGKEDPVNRQPIQHILMVELGKSGNAYTLK